MKYVIKSTCANVYKSEYRHYALAMLQWMTMEEASGLQMLYIYWETRRRR